VVTMETSCEPQCGGHPLDPVPTSVRAEHGQLLRRLGRFLRSDLELGTPASATPRCSGG
jgi:hypothetical protein